MNSSKSCGQRMAARTLLVVDGRLSKRRSRSPRPCRSDIVAGLRRVGSLDWYVTTTWSGAGVPLVSAARTSEFLIESDLFIAPNWPEERRTFRHFQWSTI